MPIPAVFHPRCTASRCITPVSYTHLDVYKRQLQARVRHRRAVGPLHAGYDHGYYFITTFVEDHIAHHARALHR